MRTRWALIVLLIAFVTSAMAWMIFPSVGLTEAIAGFLVQAAGTFGVFWWRAALGPALVVLGVALVLVYLPIGWRIAFDHDLTAWIPCTSAYATAHLVLSVRRRSDVVLGTLLISALILLLAAPSWLVPSPTSAQQANLLSALGTAAPPLAGACYALWTRLRAARRDRIAALARERELVARQRVADERSRMAAELHDLVTHQMVRVIFQARNLARPDRDDDVRVAADAIAETATGALEQMRDFLRAVHVEEDPWPDDADAVPVRQTAEQIEELVRAGRGVGQRVTLDLPSGPGTDLDASLSDAAGRCLVRTAQEGLVNAAKHAPGTPVTVRLEQSDGGCAVVVENPLAPGTGARSGPAGQADGLARSGSGTGLLGITRRAEMLGGKVTAGVVGDRFRLRVAVPFRPAAVAPMPDATAGSAS